MGEEKFAALNPGLLARKGAAKPAMRRQAYMNPQGDVAEEDLGWNDMGTPPPSQPSDADKAWKDMGLQPPSEVPSAVDASDNLPVAPSPAREQQDQLADDLGGFTPHIDHDATRNGEDHSANAGSLPGEEIEQRNGFTGFGSQQDEPVEPENLGPVSEPFEPVSETETPEIESHAAPDDDADEAIDSGLHSDAESPDPVAELAADEPVEQNADDEEYVPRNGVLNPLSPETANVNANPVKVRLPSHNKIMARDKVAFTLRLDKDRHLKLRLASAVSNQSAQLLVTEALDEFLKTIPELEALAERAPDRKSN
jgi:hypothetical protein